MRILLLFSLIIACSTCSPAQKDYSGFEFRSIAPRDTSIKEKEAFEITFEFSYPGKNAPEHEFMPPDFGKLEIISGPTKGSFSRMNMINGMQTSAGGISYSYKLKAEKKGKYTIPEARIRISDKVYKSGSMNIQVIAPDPGTMNDTTRIIFKAIAPESVEAGKPFRILFEINSTNGKDLQAPPFEGFDVLAGPMLSTSMTSLILDNGKRETTAKATYIFRLQAKKGGTITIPPARITIDDQEYKTEEIRIKVTGNIQASEL